MRSDVIFNFIKEEWYDQRRMLFWYFLISLVLGIALIVGSQQEGIVNRIKQTGFSFEELSRISFAVLFMPYAISWMMLFSRPGKENRTGFYSFLHTLPITLKEIVTAKYISTFLLNVLMAGWLCGLWWLYEVNFPDAASTRIWAGLCVVVFFFALSILALQLGFFFQWGDSNFVFMILFLFLIVNQFKFVGQLAELTINLMERNSLMLWGIAIFFHWLHLAGLLALVDEGLSEI